VPPFFCPPHTDFFPLAYHPYLPKLEDDGAGWTSDPSIFLSFFSTCDPLAEWVMQDPDTGD
jgi:hypothetical protein